MNLETRTTLVAICCSIWLFTLRGVTWSFTWSVSQLWTSVLLTRLIGQSTPSDQLTMPCARSGPVPGLIATDHWSVHAMTN